MSAVSISCGTKVGLFYHVTMKTWPVNIWKNENVAVDDNREVSI